MQDIDFNNSLLFFGSIAIFFFIRNIYIYCYNSSNIINEQEPLLINCKKKPQKRYTKLQFKENESYDSCTICLNDFIIDENILKLSCNHIYHEECIKLWFKKKSNCPNCLNSFSSDEDISPISNINNYSILI